MSTVDVRALLDEGRWGGYQKFIVTLIALTIIFDGADIQLLSIAIPTLMAEWSVDRSAFAPVLAISLAGMLRRISGVIVIYGPFGAVRA